jgi:flagellar hook-associated protein 1 FlgK
MRGTFFGIELGKRAIFAQRTGIDVTSHNIANANTEGYARQRAVLGATDSFTVPGFNAPVTAQQVGTGVDVTQIESLRNKFIDEKITKEQSTLEQKATADDLLKEIEAIFNEPGEATLRDQLDKFWASWEDLSINPSRAELRQNVTEQATTLVSIFQDFDMRLRRLQGTPDHAFQGSIENQIEDTLKQVNSLGQQIGTLNIEIERVELANGKANDLRDKRQKLLEDLAKLINAETTIDSKGHYTIRNGTHVLVQHGDVKELSYQTKNGVEAGTISSEAKYPEFSDRPDIATATLDHTASQWNFTMTVQQLAQADSKFSFLSYHPLNGKLSDFGISSGTFSLNGRQFNLDADKTTIKDLAQIITSANININASLNESGQLVMKSALTGTDSAIQTEDGTSNLFRVLNLQTATKAQNAKFSVGNTAYETQENTVRNVFPGATIYLNKTGIANMDLRPIVTNGKLKALLEVRDGTIDRIRDRLDEMAYTLVSEVNNVHRLGFGLDGQTGRNFFKPQQTNDANQPYKDACKNISIESFILNNVNTIAASGGSYINATDRLPSYNGDGDGRNAISLAQIKQTNFFNGGKANFNDYYNEIVTETAVESQRMARQREASSDMMYQLISKREEASGVSIDEEMTNLLKYQHAYNAAARVISTVDSLLDKIINGMLR